MARLTPRLGIAEPLLLIVGGMIFSVVLDAARASSGRVRPIRREGGWRRHFLSIGLSPGCVVAEHDRGPASRKA